MFSQFKTPEQIEKRRRFWRRARRRLFYALAIAFVAHLGLNIYASILLNRELAAIRQKGEPLQFAEMAPPPVPDSQNAAFVYKQATKALHFTSQERVAFATRARNQTPQTQRDIEAALRKNQKALDLTRRAAAMPRCVFPLNYRTATPTALIFPYYGEMRELARTLAAQARLEAQKGDGAAALRDVRALFSMAHHLSNEPVLIGFLVAQAMDSIAAQALAQVLENVPLTAAQARAFQASLPQSDWNRAFRRTLMGERSWGVPLFEKLSPSDVRYAISDSGGDAAPSWITYPVLLLWRPVLKLDGVQSLRLWRHYFDSPASQQVPRPTGAAGDFDAAIENAPLYAILTRILFPVFSRASDNRDNAEVRRRQREIALALAVYRTARGQYPARLGDVVALWGKPLPLDIYSNKAFVYRREGKSFTLYSVGVNRIDDGGKNRYGGESIALNIPVNADDVAWRNSRN